MTTPVCYNFDPTTGVFTGECPADESPLERGVWHFPAHSTTVAPPVAGDKQVAVMGDGAWSIEADHRGEIWWKAYGQPVLIDAAGDPSSLGFTSTEPAPPVPTAGIPVAGPVVVPAASPTNYQIRQALINVGKFDVVDATVRNSGNQSAIQAWDYANYFERQSPFIAALQAAAGFSDSDVDNLFTAALAIT